MPLACSAVIFDLDGTLIDSLEDLADAGNAALASEGLPSHPVDPYRFFVGQGMETMVRLAAPQDTDQATLARLLTRAKQVYGENWAAKTRPYDGVLEMLARLRQRGAKLMVLTNKPHEYAVEVVDHFFPDKPFDRVQGSPPGGVAKPDPTMALAMSSDAGIAPGDFLFLGDTKVDLKTAYNAGMQPVGCLWGFRPQEVRDIGAAAMLDKPLDLFAHI